MEKQFGTLRSTADAARQSGNDDGNLYPCPNGAEARGSEPSGGCFFRAGADGRSATSRSFRSLMWPYCVRAVSRR
jgi:hypothetical protein